MANSQIQKDYKNRIITIPNILSLVRLCMIPFIAVYYIKKQYLTSIFILLLSGATDVVDGFIARKFNMKSNVGQILDPVADKLTQLVIMICLCLRFPHIIFLLVCFVLKELANGIIAIVTVKKSHNTYDSRWHGKATTVLIYLMIVVHLFWVKIPPLVSDGLIFIAFAMMVVSFILYTRQNILTMKRVKTMANSAENSESKEENEGVSSVN